MESEFEEVRDKVFISPHKPSDEIRDSFDRILDDLLQFLNSSANRKVLPAELFVSFREALLNHTPKSSVEIRESLSVVMEKSMNPYNPLYIGHMDSLPTVYSIIGDLVTSALNNNLFSLEMAPFLTQLENQIAREFCELFGMPEGSAGLVLNGGTLANLQALVIARNTALGGNSGDVQASRKRYVIFCSEFAHVSIQKAAMVMGVGKECVCTVRIDEFGRMDPDDLEAKLAENADRLPIAIVATAGTTVTGNIDPLKKIGAIARDHKIWFHVDAIWGGALILSKRYKHKLDGIEIADSITFNPQKWLMVAKTCSLTLVRSARVHEESFRVKKSYVKDQSIATDLSELSIAGTKRSQGLKLWFSFQSTGRDWLETFIDRTMELTKHFERKIDDRSYLKLRTRPETAMLCMRGEPNEIPESDYDNWNTKLQDYLLRQENVFLSLPSVDGSLWQRIVLINPYTNKGHIDHVFTCIDKFHHEHSISDGN